MKLKKLLFLLIISLLWSCGNSSEPQKTDNLPKSQSKVAWKQDNVSQVTQSVKAVLESNNTITVKIKAVDTEELAFNEIPYEVGVHPIGYSLKETNDGLVGATWTSNRDPSTCEYVAIKDAEQENNHFAITYVDTSRGVISGKFKMKISKNDTSNCSETMAKEIAFTEGEFAIKLKIEN